MKCRVFDEKNIMFCEKTIVQEYTNKSQILYLFLNIAKDAKKKFNSLRNILVLFEIFLIKISILCCFAESCYPVSSKTLTILFKKPS